MKKLLQLGAILCSFLVTQSLYSQNTGTNVNPNPAQGQVRARMTQEQPARGADANQNYDSRQYNGGGQNYSGDQGGCPADHPCGDQAVGDCWCMYVHYEPCYYTTKRCVEEQVPCKKRCCRMCDKYYEVQRCRMVPEYYTETICRQEPEYYEVDDCKTCQKWVCDQHCEYVPRYYWKHVCEPDCGGCPQQ